MKQDSYSFYRHLNAHVTEERKVKGQLVYLNCEKQTCIDNLPNELLKLPYLFPI